MKRPTALFDPVPKVRVDRPSLVFVGGGPRTVSLLERLAASAPELLGAGGLEIHVVDPFPVGGGRIWRRAQSPLLWMNSQARDVTIFTDASVVCEGPIVPGPTLDQWVVGAGRPLLIEAGLRAEADAFTPRDFASREFQSHYLSWALNQVLNEMPSGVTVTLHQGRAVCVAEPEGRRHPNEAPARQQVTLEDGAVLTADLVVLAQGYLDRTPTLGQQRSADAADEHGLVYIGPGYTADINLEDLRPGMPVLVRGFGLAFIDLMVLVGQARGGRFSESSDGLLTYHPSGAEPLLYVGSRRGVPYHAKLGYTLGASAPVPPRYFTPGAIESLSSLGGPVDFRTHLWPLIVKELTAAHYQRLFEFHHDRTLGDWASFSAALDAFDAQGSGFAAVVDAAIPDPADRFLIEQIDRPLTGRTFADRDALSDALVAYVSGDLARRADPDFSADHAVFNALLTVYGVLAGAIVAGWVSPADRVQYVEGEFHGLFSFLASGPPPRRLREMLAMHRAGVVQFAGPDLRVEVRGDRFVGWSPAVPGEIEATALVDARLPRPDVSAATDPVIRGLLAAGELAAENLIAPDGSDLGGGQLMADGQCRAIRADGTVHPHRFLLGPSVSGSAGASGFARPGFNGPGFRQNDKVARQLLTLAAAVPVTVAGPNDDENSHPPLGRIEISYAS